MKEAPDDFNLLVIEDNPVDIFLLKKMLSGAPLTFQNIYEADRLEKGCDLLEKKSVQLILLDLSLPDSSGLDSLLGIHKMTNQIPVIILTGLADTNIALEAIKAGAQDYLVKGEFNENVLMRAIQYTLERRKLERKLEQEQKLRQHQITAAVLAAQERERKYIGEELHDNINQIITSAKIYISTALTQPPLREELLPKAIDHMTLAIEEIRKLSKKLISPGIKTGSLSELLQNTLTDLELASSIQFDLNLNFDENLLREETKIAVYRIIQEQLSNILKHSQATTVSIQLFIDNGKLIIITTDNGKGFDLSADRAGVGITNMISRAEMINGEVEITSHPGEGCSIKTSLPLNDRMIEGD